MSPRDERANVDETTFSSLQDFEMKMFPREFARRSLQTDGLAARALGERLAEALARDAESRLPPKHP
jgi:hypothetical protein